MVVKVLLAALAVTAAAIATTATATVAPSLIDRATLAAAASPLSTGVLPTTSRPAAHLIKLGFLELKELSQSDTPPCDLHVDDVVYSARRSYGEPQLKYVVRTAVVLRVGDNARSFDLRSSCLRADTMSPFVCHELYARDWPSFCASHPMSSVCKDNVMVKGRIAHAVRHALPHLPDVCGNLPHYPAESPEPSPMPM
ncbi:hypothetical protein MMPV_004793 [Pyropia vietnamensis]